MASNNVEQLHFLMVPLMSQSHIIPLTDFAKLVAQRGLMVTIITTPLNEIRYKPIIDRAKTSNLKIQLVALHFPSKEAGLPHGCENMDDLDSLDLGKMMKFFEASEMLREPLEKLVAEMVPPPSCIVSTNAVPWVDEVAWKFKIPWYVFHPISCFTHVLSHKISTTKVHESLASDSESFLVPDMPHKIELKRSQLPKWTRTSSKKYTNDMKEKTQPKVHPARGILVNTIEEMEPSYVEEHKKRENKLWCIGSVSLCNKELSDKLDRGNRASIESNQCLEWLDSMKPYSVTYTCFGSLCHIPPPQLIEIGLGLEMSNRPFIWIIRKSHHSAQVEKWLSEYKFEERVKGRGLIVRGWAPQVVILSHPSVAGFFTHCGWNSTLEGICAGVPMLTWPMFAEQFYNEAFLVHVLRIGVKIGVEVELEEDKVLVKSEQVKEAIEELMSGEVADERRKRAKELGEMANKAVVQGGSSYLNLTMFIEEVIQQVQQNQQTDLGVYY